MPRVSIVLPCRNAADHLSEAVASLDAQTFRDFEVVAVDDGSEDETFAILSSWARRTGQVRVLRGAGSGLVGSLAAGLAEARGELVARMDADDVAGPSRLEKQVALLDVRPEIAACGTLVRYFPRRKLKDGARRYERWLNALVEPDEIARDIFVECPIAHPTLLIRHSVLCAVGGYRDLGWPEDYDLVLRVWAAGHRMAKVREVLLHWRERAGRVSRADPRYAPEAFRRLKVHFLRSTLLDGRDGAVVWGAGPVGKRFARECLSQGVRLRGFVDLDPRKIGQSVYGVPVIAPSEIERCRGALALAAVGSAGAREEIRAALAAAGWRELEDFCAVA